MPGLQLRAGVHAPFDFSRPLAPTTGSHEGADGADEDLAAEPANNTHQEGVSIRPGLAAPQDFSVSS
ncbi:MAG: hypothetical protein U1U88_001641 [Lawsonella clevelandensis]